MRNFNTHGFVLRKALARDTHHMRLRYLDAQEVWASHHFFPDEAIQESFEISEYSFTILYRGQIVAMFGLVPDSLLGDSARVWMLTTELINDVKIHFLRFSRQVIEYLREFYPRLYNEVDARHAPCLRWLKWVGATIYPAVPHGADQLDFHPFVLGGH